MSSSVLFQQQYREKKFKKYFELITCLLVTEENNKFHYGKCMSRPTDLASFIKVNATTYITNSRQTPLWLWLCS